MGKLIGSIMFCAAFATAASTQAETAWGPETCPTMTTPGAIQWNGVEPQLFTAGLAGCYEDVFGTCDPEGTTLRIRNIKQSPIWVRFTATGIVRRLDAGNLIRFNLINDGGSVYVTVRSCSSSSRSWTYERQLTIGTPRYGVLPFGDDVHYSLVMTENQYVRITLESTLFDAYLRLYHDGALIAADDDHDGTLNSEIFQFLPIGIYSVEVSSYENRGGGGYVLHAR